MHTLTKAPLWSSYPLCRSWLSSPSCDDHGAGSDAIRRLDHPGRETAVVPLSSRCVEVLAALRTLAGDSNFMFPGNKPNRAISNMKFQMALKRLGRQETVHGFRSAFRTWVDDETDFSSDVAELALAHTIKNKIEKAYRRGNMLEKRREMMQEWSSYIANGNPKKKRTIV